MITPDSSSQEDPPIRFTGKVRSDGLADLARVLSRIEPLRETSTIFHATIIVDANVVIADLIWMCRTRRSPDARPTLLELIECSSVQAFAPTYLETEIEGHFEALQKELKIHPDAARKEWTRYRSRIQFVNVGGPDPEYPGVTDPKDVPYLRLQERLSLPIVSDDPHLPKMGASVLRLQIFAPLRAYSRHRAVEYQIKVVGVGAVLVSALVASVALRSLEATGRAISKLPKPVLAMGAIGLVAAFAHPKSRRWIIDRLDDTAEITAKALSGLYRVLVPIIEEHYAAKSAAESGIAAVRAILVDAGIAPEDVLRGREELEKLSKSAKSKVTLRRRRRRTRSVVQTKRATAVKRRVSG